MYKVEIINGKALGIRFPGFQEPLRYGPFQLIKPSAPNQTFMNILYSYRDWDIDSVNEDSQSEKILSEILNDLSYEFGQYTALNLNKYASAGSPTSVDASFAFGTAGYNKTTGGIFFYVYREGQESDWELLWKGTELHSCLKTWFIPTAKEIQCEFLPKSN